MDMPGSQLCLEQTQGRGPCLGHNGNPAHKQRDSLFIFQLDFKYLQASGPWMLGEQQGTQVFKAVVFKLCFVAYHPPP